MKGSFTWYAGFPIRNLTDIGENEAVSGPEAQARLEQIRGLCDGILQSL